MIENYAVINKTDNLIPIVNPELKGKKGIEAALLYRMNSCKEIDSSKLVREAYEQCYNAPIPESADTIFNAFIPFMDFCRSKLIRYRKQIPNEKQEEYKLIYNNLNLILYRYEDLRQLFDRYFDLMYSFSNFMPVPLYFNGRENKLGKGTWKLNRDYPSEYLKNLKDENSGIFMKKEMHEWLNKNMDSYRIKDMYRLEPPYPIDEYYGYDDSKFQALMHFVKSAIKLIEERFEDWQIPIFRIDKIQIYYEG